MTMKIKCPNPDCGEDRLYGKDHPYTKDGDTGGLYAISYWPKADNETRAHWYWYCNTCKHSFTVRYDLVITEIVRR